jgi:membrane-associated protease RseP (regulator of RpoE activity)
MSSLRVAMLVGCVGLVAAMAEAGRAFTIEGYAVTNTTGEVTIITESSDGTASVYVFDGTGRDVNSSAAEARKVTWLGVATDPVSDELRSHLDLDPGVGLLVRAVIPKSPAMTAGLKENDVLTDLDGQILMTPEQLSNLIAGRKTGDKATLKYIRRGKERTVQALLGEHEEESASVIDLGGFDLNLDAMLGDMMKGVRSGGVGVPGKAFSSGTFTTNMTFELPAGSGLSGGGGSGQVKVYIHGGSTSSTNFCVTNSSQQIKIQIP